MKAFKKIALIFLFSSIFLSAKAQKGIEIGAGGGVAYYFGDLNTSFDMTKPGLSGTVFARYNFNPRIDVKIGINYGHVQASDEYSKNVFEKDRNLSFKSDIYEVTGQFEFNFFEYIHGSRDQFYTPYIFSGFTVYNYNPQAELDGEVYDLREYGTEGQFTGDEYYTTTLALAYGIGFKVDLSFAWSLNFEISGRKLYNDYLDDVSTSYPDLADLESLRGPIAPLLADRSLGRIDDQTGRQRGDSKGKDAYFLTNLSLVYYFGSVQCPSVNKWGF